MELFVHSAGSGDCLYVESPCLLENALQIAGNGDTVSKWEFCEICLM